MADLDPRVKAGMERQLQGWRELLSGGAERIGWKIGFNIPAIQEQLGISESVVGHLTGAALEQPGGTHSLAGGTAVSAEAEVAIWMGAAVDADAGEDAAGAAIAGLGAAIEVVDFDAPMDDIERILATNIFHRAVALAPPVEPHAPSGSARVSVNGEEHAAVELSEALPDPVPTVRLVARTLAACGERLEAGDRIIAGALVPPIQVAAGDTVALDAAGIGRIELAFAA